MAPKGREHVGLGTDVATSLWPLKYLELLFKYVETKIFFLDYSEMPPHNS